MLILSLLNTLVFGLGSSVGAQAPQPVSIPNDGRPRLHLPFPGGTTYRVSCAYGCYQHRGTMSYAVDFSIPSDHPIVAAADGVIAAITWETGLPVSLHLGDALIIYIEHGGGWKTRYIHLSGITVRVGEQVKAGQIIGYGGSTGASSAHLHFELKQGESLHSYSYTIDELFGGEPPQAGTYYTSDNYFWPEGPPPDYVPAPLAPPPEPLLPPSLPAGESPAQGEIEPTPLPAPTPVPPPFTGLALHQSLIVTPTKLLAGQLVTTTFIIHNYAPTPITYSLLGVGGRSVEGQLQERTLFFQRNVTIGAGQTYTFTGARTLDAAGTLILFPFGLSEQNGLHRFAPLDRTTNMLYDVTLSEVLLRVIERERGQREEARQFFLPLLFRERLTDGFVVLTPGDLRARLAPPTPSAPPPYP